MKRASVSLRSLISHGLGNIEFLHLELDKSTYGLLILTFFPIPIEGRSAKTPGWQARPKPTQASITKKV